MAKKTKKSSKWADDDWENDIPGSEEAAPATADDGASAAVSEAESTPGPQEAVEATEDDFMSAIKKSKTKKKLKEDEEKAKPKTGPVIKSKKEKEREKKELEKQRKKEIAEKKKAAADARKLLEDAAKAKKNGGVLPVEESKPEPVKEELPVEEPKEEKKSAPKKKKGVPNAAIAALKKQMELRKQLEEQQRLEEEEEKRREEEEELLRLAEELLKEEARKLKKEKEKAKKEQLKAEGKFLTKKQKEEKKLQEKRRLLLLASGVVVPALNGDAAATPAPASKPKRILYGAKKKKTTDAEAEAKAKAEAEAKKLKELLDGEEEVLEDWEAMADGDEPLVEDWELALSDDAEGETEGQSEGNSEGQSEGTTEGTTEGETDAEAEAKAAAEAKAKAEAEAKAAAEAAAQAKAAEEKKKQVSKKSKTPAQDESNMRSPICCILGHVDTGKTKLLDKIRQTNVQGGEAGGITQQIGATYFPVDAIKQKTAVMAAYEKQTFDVPGLLIIDTPGHESFTNLRSRGSSLCNIAVLVIDIMHGLEQQTIESLRLLRERKAPFIVALNKIDRLYDWKETPNNSFRDSFAKQGRAVQSEFQDRLEKVKLALAEQGLNSELYFQNRNMSKYVSIVPTSAVTGEGVPDLIWLLLELTQKRMSKQLMYLSKIEATVLEVKVVEGLGTTIDVVLSNGILREGDRIVICGLNGPIATNVRALLTPQPLRELRIKSEYVHHKEVKAALGVKIAANDLEKAVAGSRLLVVGEDDDEDELMDEVMDDLTGLLDSVDTTGRGVTVQASTLGSLEALLDFLKDMKIPVMSIGLGPVYKRDVMKATTMLEKAKEYAVMLCFDVKIDKEAEQYAEEQGIKIFSADIIYHLFDAFTAYQLKLLEQRRKDFLHEAVFPCALRTIQIINKREPMIIGVDVLEGTVRIGTPICAVRTDPVTKAKNVLLLGRVASLEVNHKSETQVKKGQTAQGVAVRLDNPSGQQPVWGRHVDESDTLYSHITRRSIDTLKDPAFRDSVPREDWLLIKTLKGVFDIK